jgi:hypothetical protein
MSVGALTSEQTAFDKALVIASECLNGGVVEPPRGRRSQD